MLERNGSDAAWQPLDEALEHAADQGRAVDIWLRDDDAATGTAALDRLVGVSRRFDLPVLLAVIPEPADEALAAVVANCPLLTPAQHGYSHTNHAGPGERACELGGTRPLAAVCDDLARGRAKMEALFGRPPSDVLVPPWNRIAPALLPHLPALGFGALSTFADAHAAASDIAVINCDLDIIDWRRGRIGRPADQLARRLAALIAEPRPIGILTHHLAHDETAWRCLDACFARLSRHDNVRLVAFQDIRAGRAAPGHRTPTAAG